MKEESRRYYLAQTRTHLANERTLLAYWRTALTFLLTGAALIKFFPDFDFTSLASISIIIGILLFVFSFVRYFSFKKKVNKT
jgi:putative membrane protein